MVNLELYRIFKIVAEKEENLTKASGILHISQLAVTKHIKNLSRQNTQGKMKQIASITKRGFKEYQEVIFIVIIIAKKRLL